MTQTALAREPQSRSFGHLTITFDDRVLRPRSWTTLQSQWAADLLGHAPRARILELCAGAGHIGLLAASISGASLVCVDVDPDACAFARANAAAAGLGERVEVRCGPLEEVARAEESFDLVIADPPWVRRDAVSDFPEDPVLAIDGGDDGLAVARACLLHARATLSPGSTLLLQLGEESQADDLQADIGRCGWRRGELRRGARGVVLQLVAT